MAVRIYLTIMFLWTVLDFFIMLKWDGYNAPKWAVAAIWGWVITWSASAVVVVIGVIWTTT